LDREGILIAQMGDIIHCRKKNEKLDIENDIAL